MADVAILSCESREKVGTAESRRLRRRGLVPINLYGHQQDAVTISADHEALKAMVYGGIQVVELEGAAADMAMIREIQWDTFGIQLLHVDLLRVDRDEKVVLEVPVELRGTAPGVLAGGVLETPRHTLTVECAVFMIPSSIQVRIVGLEIGDTINAGDVQMPDGVDCLNDPGEAVVQVSAAKQVADDELVPEAGGAAEPSLVGGEEEE